MTGYRLLMSIGFIAAFHSTTPPLHNPKAPRTHIVRMQGGRFSPSELTIGKGDTVKFVLGTGGPHNVAFNETKGDAAVKLRTLMPNQIADLAGPLLVNSTDTYSIVFGDMPAGTYPYWCLPHLSMGQMGAITVR